MFSRTIVRLLERLVATLPHRTITNPAGDPYLTRWFVWPRQPRDNDPFPFAVFIHHFHRSDEDRNQHNHPWHRSWSLILAGGYREVRGSARRIFRPGSINVIRKDDYHRVDLLDPQRGCWSLFIAGKNVGDWGFRDEATGEHIPSKEYLDRKFSTPYVLV